MNGYYDFKNSSVFTPYFGAGIGIGFIENAFRYGPVNFEDKETALVWQGSAGISTSLTEKIEGFVDAKYFSATGLEFVRTSPADNGVSLTSEYDNFTISAGYRYKF